MKLAGHSRNEFLFYFIFIHRNMNAMGHVQHCNNTSMNEKKKINSHIIIIIIVTSRA